MTSRSLECTIIPGPFTVLKAQEDVCQVVLWDSRVSATIQVPVRMLRSCLAAPALTLRANHLQHYDTASFKQKIGSLSITENLVVF